MQKFLHIYRSCTRQFDEVNYFTLSTAERQADQTSSGCEIVLVTKHAAIKSFLPKMHANRYCCTEFFHVT